MRNARNVIENVGFVPFVAEAACSVDQDDFDLVGSYTPPANRISHLMPDDDNAPFTMPFVADAACGICPEDIFGDGPWPFAEEIR